MHKSTRLGKHSVRALSSYNFDSWMHTPRTLVMFVAAILLCFVESRKLFRAYSIDGNSLNLTESVFLLASTGFNILLSSMLFLVMVNELPQKISFQYYALLRSSRKQWLNSQVLYCVEMVLAFLAILLFCSYAFCACNAAWKAGWSPIMEDESYGTYRWVSELLISNFSPFSALLIALIPIAWTWFTITMFILLMNIFDLGKLGLIIVAFALIADYISIQSSLPFSSMQYSTLLSIDSSGNGAKSFAIMIVLFMVVNSITYIIMRIRVSKMDLNM